MADDALPICDYCGDVCGHNTDCNALSCTFTHCEEGVYHQDCLYQFLKANKLEKNRKTGFKCPRGCGKGTKWPTPCPGRIDKSHPIIPKNEDRAKKRLATVAEAPPKPPRPDKAAEKAVAKARAEQEKAQAAAAAAARAKEEERAMHKANGVLLTNANKPVPARALASAIGERPVKAKHKAGLDLQAAQLLRDQALQEIGLLKPGNGAGPSRAVAAAVNDKAVNGKAAAAVNGLWNGKAAAAQPEQSAPPPAVGTSLGDLITLATLGKAKGRATAERTLSGGGNASDGGGAVSPLPLPQHSTAPLDVQNPQHFPPVGAARAVSPAHNKLAAAAWPTVAAAAAAVASPVASSRLQRQGSEPGVTSALHHDAAAELAAHATISTAGSGALAVNGDIAPAQQQHEEDEVPLTKAQRKNIKRAEKKKRHSVPELEELDVGGATANGLVLEQQLQPIAPTTPSPITPASHAATAKADTPAKSRNRKEPVVQAHLLEHADSQLQQQQLEATCVNPPTVSTRLSSEQQTASVSPSSCSPSTVADLASGSLQAHDDVHVGLLQHTYAAAELLDMRGTMGDLCVAELVTRKCRLLYQQLRRLSFSSWQAAAAIRAHGVSMQPALEWLLEHRMANPQQLWHVAEGLPLPMVDISFELMQVHMAHQALPRDLKEELLPAVIQCNGDVGMAVASVQSGAWRSHLFQQSSLQSSTYFTARSDIGATSLSRAHTMHSCGDMFWGLDESHSQHALPQQSEPLSSTLSQLQPMLSSQQQQAGLMEAGASSHHGSLSHMGFSSVSLPGLLQHCTPSRQATWGGTGQASLDTGVPDSYYLSAGDEAQGGHLHTPTWGEESSSYSGVYSRQGVNGSMGTWESHGSADVAPARAGRSLPTPAPDPASDEAELNSLMALCAQ